MKDAIYVGEMLRLSVVQDLRCLPCVRPRLASAGDIETIDWPSSSTELSSACM